MEVQIAAGFIVVSQKESQLEVTYLSQQRNILKGSESCIMVSCGDTGEERSGPAVNNKANLKFSRTHVPISFFLLCALISAYPDSRSSIQRL
jgi:hypothetical protein